MNINKYLIIHGAKLIFLLGCTLHAGYSFSAQERFKQEEKPTVVARQAIETQAHLIYFEAGE